MARFCEAISQPAKSESPAKAHHFDLFHAMPRGKPRIPSPEGRTTFDIMPGTKPMKSMHPAQMQPGLAREGVRK